MLLFNPRTLSKHPILCPLYTVVCRAHMAFQSFLCVGSHKWIVWEGWDIFLSLWESQRWWFREVSLVDFPTLSLCPLSLFSPYVYFKELLESWPGSQLGWQRQTPCERGVSQPSRAGLLIKHFVWGIAVSCIFSMLVPVKLVILSVQQSNLRLTQTLQFCF